MRTGCGSALFLIFVGTLEGQFLAQKAAGGGPSGFNAQNLPRNFPSILYRVAVDTSANYYLSNGTLLWRVDRITNAITLLAGTTSTATANNPALPDSLPALTARFASISKTCVDSAGNVFILDNSLGTIYRRRNSDGLLERWAGTGALGIFNGDNISSLAATLQSRSFTCDSAGNLFITEPNRIRRVTTNRIITTIAGTGTAGDTNDGVAAAGNPVNNLRDITIDPQGNLLFAELRNDVNGRVRRILSNGTLATVAGALTGTVAPTSGPAVNAQVRPRDLATDSQGNVYIFILNRILRVLNATGEISEFRNLNSGQSVLGYMSAAGDSLGNLYYFDLDGVRRVTVSNGTNVLVAAFGNAHDPIQGVPATGLRLPLPAGIALDRANRLYFTQSNMGFVGRVETNGTASVIFGTYPPPVNCGTTCVAMGALTVDQQDKVYFVQQNPGGTQPPRVRRFTVGGVAEDFAGGGQATTGADVAANTIRLTTSSKMTVDRTNGILITNETDCVIWRVTTGTLRATRIAGTGTCGNGGEGVPAVSTQINRPDAITADRQGNIYFVERLRDRVRRIDVNGVLTTFAGSSAGFGGDGGAAVNALLDNPTGLAVDEAGVLYIADTNNHRVRRVNGTLITTIAGNGTAGLNVQTPATAPFTSILCFPRDLAIDKNLGIHVLQSCNNQIDLLFPRIAIISSQPGVSIQAGATQRVTPHALAADIGQTISFIAPDIFGTTTPGVRFKFLNWNGTTTAATTSLTANNTRQVALANYQPQVQVQALVTPESGGVVNRTPPSADGFYPAGTANINLTAVPNSGFSFAGYSIGLLGNAASVTLPVLGSPISTVATFLNTTSGYQPMRINAGGQRLVDSASRIWTADPLNPFTANVVSTSTAITVPAGSDLSPGIYQTARFSSTTFSYVFAVPNGSYNVRLKFAEIQNAALGTRVFDIRIQNQLAQASFDIRRDAGGVNRAIDLLFTAAVTDGRLRIELTPVTGNILINGLQVQTNAVGVTVVPALAEVGPGASFAFSYALAGSEDRRVMWSVVPPVGTVSEEGVYTAPSEITSRQAVSVIATSVTDPLRSARADVVLSPPWQEETVEERRFQYQRIEGDFALQAHVDPGTARAGLMIRESLGSDAPHALFDIGSALGATLRTRGQTGAETVSRAGASGARWLRLVRQGNFVTALVSLDGKRWSETGAPVEVELGGAVLAGFAMSGDARFDETEWTPPSSVAIRQAVAYLDAGQRTQFSADVSGAPDGSVLWTVEPAIGDITPEGVYTAPAAVERPVTVTVTATSAHDARVKGTALVTIGEFRPIRVNAGGSYEVTPSEEAFAADTNFSAGLPLAVGVPAAVTRSARTAPDGFFYQFPVPRGQYTLKLHFAELQDLAPGDRVFHVRVNGEIVAENFDPVQTAGAINLIADLTIPVVAAEGQVVVSFEPVRGAPIVSAIELLP